MRKLMTNFTSVLLVSCGLAGTAAAGTLADVKARGLLNCGVNTGLLGFAKADDKGNWAGFDVDYCKAVAAAVLGDASKVIFVPLTAQARFEALSKKEIDVLSRNTTWTMERETKFPFSFAGVSYYDGQGFMMKTIMGVTSVFNMDQASVCTVKGTNALASTTDFFKEHNLTFSAVEVDTASEGVKAFEAGKCDALAADQSQLYAQRLTLAKPDEALVLPEVISKEPLGPVVRNDDAQWSNIARWTLNALINAEELEVRSATVADKKANSKNAGVRRLLGVEGTLGQDLGLDAQWAERAIAAVGNYGEMFERNFGEATPLKFQRGLNAPWNKGGVLYAAPVR
jgi:general L-amino acid transport system substrate-binding protein